MSGTKKEVKDALQLVSKYISSSEELTDDVKEAIDNIMSDYDNQFKTYLVSFVKAKIDRVYTLLNTISSIEYELDARIASGDMSTKDMVGVLSVMQADIKSLTSLIFKLSSLNESTPGININNPGGVNIQQNIIVTKEKRHSDANIMSAVERIIDKVNKHEDE